MYNYFGTNIKLCSHLTVNLSVHHTELIYFKCLQANMWADFLLKVHLYIYTKRYLYPDKSSFTSPATYGSEKHV